ncbi:Y-family DNA polymerase [Planctomicrobium sp. SH668]|uniref:Y-family DNA polymerase n=1 Tax=Planctomicrobium sp. SH668 TaxID=3448126 RepID=UPI003F5B084C
MPVILHSSLRTRTPQVTACCERAMKRHVRIGMPVAEAQTLVRHSLLEEHDPAADREQLRTLAWQCQRFTPCAGLEPAEQPESLFLDVTGYAAHFGGIESLCQQVADGFHQQDYQVRIAVAPTFGAAWGLVHFPLDQRANRRSSPPVTAMIVNTGELQEQLVPLPVQALRLPASVVSLLKECGLTTIGQFRNIPRTSLPSRFGPELLQRLDQAFGHLEELLEPDFPPVPVRSEFRFEFPLTQPGDVEQALWELLKNILSQLIQRQRETLQITCGWKTEAGETGTFEIRVLRPTSQFDRLRELLFLKLDTLLLSAGIVAVWLEAVPCSSQAPKRKTLFDDEGPGYAEFLQLIERLSSRLGEQAVVRYQQIAEPLPERSCIAEPWLTTSQEPADNTATPVQRIPRCPLRLLPEPVRLRVVIQSTGGGLLRFRWQGEEQIVSQLHGPERLITGWWRSEMVRRDYYRIETTTGTRFWLFREQPTGHWFLQGVFE